MLIDDFLPEYDVQAQQSIIVHASVEKIYEAARELDIGRLRLTRLLLKLRGLPASSNLALKNLPNLRFTILGEKDHEELVLGLVGKFWLPTARLRKLSAESFHRFDKPGYAKAVWNFSMAEKPDHVLLSTETRVICTDKQSRRLFRIYWSLVGTFSGLIRREILQTLKGNAEQSQPG